MRARLVNAALGLWLMAAPALLGYDGIAATTHRIIGPLTFTFAVIAIWEITRPLRFMNLLFALVLIVSPLVLGFRSAEAINSIVVGVALAILAFVPGTIEQQFGGGWSSLWRSSDEAS